MSDSFLFDKDDNDKSFTSIVSNKNLSDDERKEEPLNVK
jgi:hypothetical protein